MKQIFYRVSRPSVVGGGAISLQYDLSEDEIDTLKAGGLIIEVRQMT